MTEERTIEITESELRELVHDALSCLSAVNRVNEAKAEDDETE
jgi:hypothetical protein